MVARLITVAVVVSLAAALPAREASGQAGPDAKASQGFARRGLAGQLGATFNNPGLQNTITAAWVKPIGDSTKPLLADASVSFALVSITTPTMTRAGAWVEYAPLSIFRLRAGAEPVGYFGTFSSLMAFDSYDDSYDQDVLSQKQGTKAGVGLRSYVTPTVQFRAGRIAARASADFEYWRSSGDGTCFYEATRDQLLASGGDTLINTTSVALYEHRLKDGSLSAGIVHGLTRVFAAGGNQSQKLGVIAIRQFGRAHLRLPRPSLTVAAYRYLDDPSKRHTWGGAFAIGYQAAR